MSDYQYETSNVAAFVSQIVRYVAAGHYFYIRVLIPEGKELIHRFFAKSCLNLDVIDEGGKRFVPRERFIVPLPVIEEAIKKLISGDIANYRYDQKTQEIKPK